MSRSSRLFDLIQELRRHRRPVTADALAAELGVSARTIYRDIGVLIGQGASIEGEAGVGYVLRPGFFLPPLMFTDEEIEALVLGLRWVGQRSDQRGDRSLGSAAQHALAKVASALPPDLRDLTENAGLYPVTEDEPAAVIDLALVRTAIRGERKLKIRYAGPVGDTERVVWPLALAFFERLRMLTAWCELRDDFRIFRVDRIATAQAVDERYPKSRRTLLKAWRIREGLPEDALLTETVRARAQSDAIVPEGDPP
jgi:predicted DNA-binding transcriptional regulator YafY